jgi:alpha-tubulin suppressor-like RCC1 family protein
MRVDSLRTLALTAIGALAAVGWAGAGPASHYNRRTATAQLSPSLLSSASATAAAIATGDAHTCALTNARGVKCWGFNQEGQLGDGTSVNRHVPVTVAVLARVWPRSPGAKSTPAP